MELVKDYFLLKICALHYFPLKSFFFPKFNIPGFKMRFKLFVVNYLTPFYVETCVLKNQYFKTKNAFCIKSRLEFTFVVAN